MTATDNSGNVSDAATASATTPDVVPPTAPGSLSATAAASGTQIDLSWSAASDAGGISGYLIEMCSGGGCGSFAQIAGTGSTSYSATGLTSATSYSFRVRAYDAASNYGGYSPTASATTPDVVPPSPPATLTATATSGTQINLSWSAASDNVGVALYLIERCQSSGCSSFAQIASTGSTSYSVTGLAIATSYSFRVRARDAASNNGGYSNTASTTTLDTIAPSTPAALTASSASSTQINLTWAASADNVGVTGYAVERCQGADCLNFAQVGTTGTNSYGSTGLTPATSYSFRVRAHDAAPNYSGYSAVVSATTNDTVAPTAPGSLTAAAASSTQVNLSWMASTDNVAVTGYSIERCQGSACSNFTEVATTTTATTYSDTGLTQTTAYRYRVRARDAIPNYSPYSSVAPATTHDGQAPSTPTGLMATPASGTQINLSWTASSDNGAVTGYLVERCQGASCTNFAQIATPTTTSYSDTSLTSATTYRYRVRARDATPTYSNYSMIVAATTPDTQAPSTPAGLTATPISGTQINLGWTASTDNVAVTGYAIERCEGAVCTTFIEIGTSTSTAYNDTGLTSGTAYRYRLRARDAIANYSGYSSIATATATTPAGNANLVAAYAFDEGTGTTVADLSGSGNGGTLTNGPLWTSGKTAGGLSFDGSNDFVAVPTIDISGPALTLMGWVRFSSFPAGVDQRIVSKANDSAESGHWWMLSQVDSSTPRLRFRLKTGGTTTTLIAHSGTLAIDTWYHAAAVYDGAAMRLYLNGNEVGSRAKSGSIDVNPSIGVSIARNPNSFGYLNGALDDVRIYQRALSSAEIVSDMNTPVSTGGGGSDGDAPTAPTNLTATPGSGTQINLSWSASADNVGVTGYLVERCPAAGCTDFAQIATPATTSYTDTGLPPSTTYRYRVRARDAANNLGAYSTIVSATSADTEPPTVPTNVTGTPISATQINLSWTASTDNVGVTGYQVDRCQGSGCTSFSQMATPTTNSYSNTDLTHSTTYRYRIRARDAAGNLSGNSTIVTASTADLQSPTTPSGLTLTVGTNQVALAWTASTDNVGVTAYLIESCAGPGCTYSQIASVSTTSYTDATAAPATSHSYRVRARDAAGNFSAYSTVGSVVTADCD